MKDIDQIKEPVKDELLEFEKFFRNCLKSSIPLLDIITRYLIRRKGKQIRPAMVLLSASMLGTINESTYTAASLIELLHTASLVHDDVVDESYERRGYFSLKALWNSKLAVLTGDFLLAKGLLVSLERKEYQLLEIVSEAVREMSEGEIMQIQKIRNLNLSMEDYFEIIRKKTAALLSACAASGAKSVNATEEDILRMKQFGEYTGLAFQIKDDLLDYQIDGKTGKTMMNDIKEKKMTLPLLFSLHEGSGLNKRKIRKLIQKENYNLEKIDEII